MNKTKVVATVGPASRSYENLLKLVKAGVNVFRLNFSHGSHEQHLEVMQSISRINETYGTHISILCDLQGPKLRVGLMKNGGVEVKNGSSILFTNKEEVEGTAEKVYMAYEYFANDVKPGEKVLIDDGKLVLEVLETNGTDEVMLKVVHGGMLKSRKGVNLPNTKISLPSLTPKDEIDLDFILTRPEVDWIALSFVRYAEDMIDLKERIQARGHSAKMIAKIEKPEALENIIEIIDATDAVMVARGDLGVEVPMEQLPLTQKYIVAECVKRATPVIVATHMMESMIDNPSPTRAEITDVANAVIDGADAVMLSGETSVGSFPITTVEKMVRIITEAEKHEDVHYKGLVPSKESGTYLADAICYNTCKIAGEVDASAIIAMTASGYTGFKIASNRPNCPIYVFSHNRNILAQLNLVWGVRAFYYSEEDNTTDETIEEVQNELKKRGLINPGDIVINTGSMPVHYHLRTNMLKISTIK
jgi:pyruvate kinase